MLVQVINDNSEQGQRLKAIANAMIDSYTNAALLTQWRSAADGELVNDKEVIRLMAEGANTIAREKDGNAPLMKERDKSR